MTVARLRAVLGEVVAIFSRQERLQLLGLLFLMFTGAWVEVLGIGLIIPLMGILTNPAVIHQQPVLSWAYAVSGASSETAFMVIALCGLVLLFVIKNVLLALLYYSQARFVVYKEASMASELLARYLAAPYALHLDRNSAELIRTVTNEVARVSSAFIQPLLTLVTELLVVVLIAVLLVYIDPLIAFLVVILMAITGLLLLRYFRVKLSVYRHESRRFGIQAQKWATQALGGLKEVKVFRAESYFNSAFESNIRGYARGNQVYSFLNQTPRLIVETLAVSSILLLVAVMLYRSGDIREIVPLLAVFALSSIRIMPSVTRIIAALNSLRFSKPALDAVSADLKLVRQDAGSISAPTGAAIDTRVGSAGVALEFDDVWYRHPGMEKWILENTSFTVARGECIAIVGYSGAGKSTLADLLLGLLEPSKGRVIIDGMDLRVDRESRARIGYVPQHPYLLDDSVRRNVAFGVADGQIDDERVWTALELARLAEKLRATSQGLDVEVGERGVKLSGGERQRLSIARALYFNPDVVVFDEATSSLDQYTEREINDTISGLAGSKTLIVVTHRLAAAARCDRVVFLEHGRIKGTGKFEELYESSDAFRKMVGEPSDQNG